MLSPKERAFEFAKHKREKGIYFVFETPGDEKYALSYIQRMRVAISRIRVRVKRRGLSVAYFKMILVKIEPDAEKNVCKITVQKVFANNEVNAIIEQAFEPFISGKTINL